MAKIHGTQNAEGSHCDLDPNRQVLPSHYFFIESHSTEAEGSLMDDQQFQAWFRECSRRSSPIGIPYDFEPTCGSALSFDGHSLQPGSRGFVDPHICHSGVRNFQPRPTDPIVHNANHIGADVTDRSRDANRRPVMSLRTAQSTYEGRQHVSAIRNQCHPNDAYIRNDVQDFLFPFDPVVAVPVNIDWSDVDRPGANLSRSLLGTQAF